MTSYQYATLMVLLGFFQWQIIHWLSNIHAVLIDIRNGKGKL